MPKKFVANVREVEGSTFIQPFQAPVDAGSNAQSVKDILSIGVQAFKDVEKSRLKTQLEKETSEFIGTEEMQRVSGALQQEAQLREQTAGLLDLEGDRAALNKGDLTADEFVDQTSITAQEEQLILGAKRTTNKLHNAFVKGRISETEFKARTETILKGFINRAPGLASEFRQVAAGVLGFDPSGTALQAAFDAETSSSTLAKAQRNKIAGLLIDAGIYDSNKSADDNISENWPAFSRLLIAEKQGTLEYEAWKKTNEVSEVTDLQMLSQSAMGIHVKASNNINDIIGTKFNLLTQTDIDSIPLQERAGIIARLEQGKAAMLTGANATYDRVSDKTKISTVLKGTLDQYDTAITMLQGKVTADVYKNRATANQQLALAGITANPSDAKLISFLQLWPKGVPLSSRVSKGVHERFKHIYDALNTKGTTDPWTAVTRNQTGPDAVQSQKDLKQKVQESWKVMRNRMNDGTIDENSVAKMAEIMQGFTYASWKDPSDIQLESMDMIFTMAKDPEFVKVVKGNKLLQTQMGVSGANYSERILNSLGSDIESNLSSGQTVTLELDDGSVSFAFENINSAAAKAQVKKFNTTYVTRLNNVIRSFAHINGNTDYRRASAQLLKGGSLGNINIKLIGSDADLIK